MNKRFSNGEVEDNFTKPTKLTRQKQRTENSCEFVQLEQQALLNFVTSVVLIILKKMVSQKL